MTLPFGSGTLKNRCCTEKARYPTGGFIMKRRLLLLVVLLALVFSFSHERRPLRSFAADTGIGFCVQRVELSVLGQVVAEYALTDIRTREAVFYFESRPIEWRFTDYDGDGIDDDLVYVVPMKQAMNVGAHRGFLRQVAINVGDGHFRPSETIAVFDGRA